ncbi:MULTISPECIES: hypothetical protein [unclassified Streptomyces]|nr:hypothetical protein [Streptomyces sp. NBC_01455]
MTSACRMDFGHVRQPHRLFDHAFANGLMCSVSLTLYVFFKKRDWL